MVRTIRELISLSLLAFCLLLLFPFDKRAEEYKPGYKYALAFRFNFWTINSRLYYCKGKPLTFYYRQDFEAGVAERFKTYKGELLMKFGGGSLTLEGLGLNEIGLEENVTRRIPSDPFFETLKIKDSAGKEYTAIDISPYAPAFADGCKGWISRFNCKLNGHNRDFRVAFNVNGDKTHIKFVEVSLKDKIEQENIVGEFDYEAQYQDTPWVLNYDLDGDGSDEIIVILNYYRNLDLLVFSTNPEKFKAANTFEKILNSMGGDNNWPNDNSELFKAGKTLVIPFRNLEILEKEHQTSK